MTPAGGVFISWGSPDATAVRSMVERLKGLGIHVWEYSEDMPGGARIQEQVMDVINDVRVAIICFSDETANRTWVEREVAWAVQAQRRSQSLDHIIPVWVGPHPANLMPSLIKEMNFAVLDVSMQTEAAYKRLIDDVLGKLGTEAPIIVPAALYAMDEEQAAWLFEQWTAGGEPPALSAMFTVLGMGQPPPLYELLTKRYGPTRDDLKPFAFDESLVETVRVVVASVNQARAAEEKPPLYVRWVHDALAGRQGRPAKDDARDRWLSGDSLLIVDSISALHPDIKTDLQGLPELTQTAVVWLPPYTQHMVKVEDDLQAAVDFFDRLGDEFRRLERQPQRAISFDASTRLAVRLWLRRTLAGFSDEAAPQLDLIRSIQADSSGRRPLSRILGTVGR